MTAACPVPGGVPAPGCAERGCATLAWGNLDRLMPLHVVIGADGHVRHAGPTFERLFPQPGGTAGGAVAGASFFDRFEVLLPVGISTPGDLAALAGRRLRVRVRHGPDLVLRGLAVPLSSGGEVLLNLSFGIAVVDAVRRFGLTNDDFAATDLATELLYVIEAKSAVLDESCRLNERLRAARAAAEEQAFTDALTGLANRRAMDGVLDDLVEGGRAFGLMRIDLDFFKEVNDRFGHAAGDHVLQTVARILRDDLREGDTVARVGGDEFVILLRDRTAEAELSAIAARIIARLSDPISFDGAACRIAASIGATASSLYPAVDTDRMLRDADAALYRSKREGRSRATIVTPEMLASGDFRAALGGESGAT